MLEGCWCGGWSVQITGYNGCIKVAAPVFLAGFSV
jgi:hypothetical protein